MFMVDTLTRKQASYQVSYRKQSISQTYTHFSDWTYITSPSININYHQTLRVSIESKETLIEDNGSKRKKL
ncbi:hypothetical protein YC2023_102598 [Brassica napus]